MPAQEAATTQPPPSVPAGGWTAEVSTGGPVAVAADLTGDGARTRLTLSLSSVLEYQVFTLADPFRIIIDVPDLGFQLPRSAGQAGLGLVKAFRYGLFAPGKSRIVVDVTGPVRIEHAMIGTPGRPARLTLDISRTERAGFIARPPPSRQTRSPDHDDSLPRATPATGKPVVIIDPGHGGIDGGALGAGDLQEKNVVLAVAQHLHSVLASSGRYDARMTRSSDVFVSLEQRLALSRAHGASLFISIHADSVAETKVAQSVRGATVYTLSEQASNREAQLLADKENAADTLAGVEALPEEEGDQVKGILIDLMKRETQNFSTEFRNLLLTSMRRSVAIARDPARAAAFKVLKQTQTPSVLIELGYMSHAGDIELLKSVAWQRQVAGSIASAVHTYFGRRSAQRP